MILFLSLPIYKLKKLLIIKKKLYLKDFMDVQYLSIRDDRIGKFEKHERVFSVEKVDNNYR